MYFSINLFLSSKYTFWVQSQLSTAFLAKVKILPNYHSIIPIIVKTKGLTGKLSSVKVVKTFIFDDIFGSEHQKISGKKLEKGKKENKECAGKNIPPI